MDNIYAIIDGNQVGNLSDGALVTLISILMVFVILLIIIGITTLIFKAIGLFEMKKEIDEYKKTGGYKEEETEVEKPNVDIKDEDMMVAVLVASIDYQNEIKKDVRLVNVKEL
ncbi:OadG family protein [bacterium]|nr:OadG family protein [bacterium]